MRIHGRFHTLVCGQFCRSIVSLVVLCALLSSVSAGASDERLGMDAFSSRGEGQTCPIGACQKTDGIDWWVFESIMERLEAFLEERGIDVTPRTTGTREADAGDFVSGLGPSKP